MEIIKGSLMDRSVSEFQQDRMGSLTAGLNWLVPFIFGRSNRKLIRGGVGLAHRLWIISFSDQSKILTLQEKNIEAIAFGLIAVIKIGKGIQK
jgi:hypothetical protein